MFLSLLSICLPSCLPYLERRKLIVADRRLTVEDTVVAYWYCLGRGTLASATGAEGAAVVMVAQDMLYVYRRYSLFHWKCESL